MLENIRRKLILIYYTLDIILEIVNTLNDILGVILYMTVLELIILYVIIINNPALGSVLNKYIIILKKVFFYTA